LLEAGFVALPSGLFGNPVPDFRELVGRIMTQEKLEFSRIKTWVNAQRIGVLIEGISDSQSSSIKEIRGPKASAAYDLNNLPTPAATGFAAAQGLELKDLVIKEVDGERFIFARKMSQGQDLDKCLPRLCQNIFAVFPFSCPTWSERSLFPQPLANLCAMLDDQLIDIEIEGVRSEARVISFQGLRRGFLPLESALAYPALMKQLNLMNEIGEKRKNFDARIRSILPEGHMVRDPAGFLNDACLFYENSHPLLVKFEKKFLEMPEVIVAKVVSGYFEYLVCEDARGKMLAAAVALPRSSEIIPDESDIRAGILNQQLEKVYQIWSRDVQSLPGRIERLAEQINDLGQLRTELFCNCSLSGIGEGLCEILATPVDEQKMVAALITLIEEGEKTEIGRLLQGTGFSVIFNRLIGVEAFNPYIDSLKEVCRFFEGRIKVPESKAAVIVCLSVLLQGFINGVKCFDCRPEKILDFLFCSNLHLDLFAVFSSLFPGLRLDRKMWIEKACKLVENQVQVSIEQFSGAAEFDPAGLNEAVREWKMLEDDDFDECQSLYGRIRAKIAGIEGLVEAKPESELEIELSNRLKELEVMVGVDYHAIFSFFVKEKVNIEACLMNLPAVLDDTTSEFSARISLLQRLNRQLVRLPFVKKEKKSEKS
jgi:hypothetical protein